MLTRLTVSNYALINELAVDFHKGLNSITGETGAGKSIILGAIGLITGNRADLTVLKEKDQKCIVEGIFNLEGYNLESFFLENDLDFDIQTILRREITPAGKSRAFVNDTPVNLKTMRILGLKLLDIHSQHQNLELGSRIFQLDLVDAVAETGSLLKSYRNLYRDYSGLKRSLEELILKSEKAQADLDYYQFQYTQLEEANLQPDEQEELESELEVLNHAGEIKSALVRLQELLDNDQFSALQGIKDSHKLMGSIEKYMPEAGVLAGRIESCLIEVKDILDEAAQLADKTEYNPSRAEEVNDRLGVIYSLQQKHHVATVKELLDLQKSLGEKIEQATGYDQQISASRKKLEQLQVVLQEKADELERERRSSFSKIEEHVVNDLMQLGMSRSRFRISHQKLDAPGPYGQDGVSFLFSANSDMEPDEISRIASGGEMSRLMLAIKNLLRISKKLPTIIFDEIDAGISGEIAVKMGNILKTFSITTQIINITHLPQIAARGDAHFSVYKYEENNRTYTTVKQLHDDERVEELAKMVGGENPTGTTRETARELLKY